MNKGIINLLFGVQFVKSEMIFVVLLPLIFIRMLTSTYGAVLIMGDGSKFFSQGVFIGALINIVLNIILVPKYGPLGAAIATLVCESLQGVYLYICFRRYCESKLMRKIIIPMIGSIIMFIILFFINDRFNVLINIVLGASLYFITVLSLYCLIYPNIRSKIFKVIREKI